MVSGEKILTKSYHNVQVHMFFVKNAFGPFAPGVTIYLYNIISGGVYFLNIPFCPIALYSNGTIFLFFKSLNMHARVSTCI